MGYTNKISYIKNYLTKILSSDILPKDTAMESKKTNRKGIKTLGSFDYIHMKTELPTTKEKQHTTSRYGISVDPEIDAFWPHYIKNYNLVSMTETINRIITNSILEANPTPVSTYATLVENNQIGSAVIDLNNLKTKDGRKIKAERLDRILVKADFPDAIKGFPDITSFKDVQEFMSNEYIKNTLSPRAIIQVALISFFIPNATGQTDSNSRNIIILDNDIAVGIDAESNTYIADLTGSRSGKKLIPKGIYHENEPLDEFLKNISSAGNDIDWFLFGDLMLLSQEYTKRSNLDEAISNKGFYKNGGQFQPTSPYEESLFTITPHPYALDSFAYGDFSEKTIERAKRYNENVMNALKNCFLESDFRYGEELENIKIAERLFPVLYNSKGLVVNEQGEPEKQ